MAKEASYVTLARVRCHWGNKKIGVFRKKGHFSFYCLNGNENASMDNGGGVVVELSISAFQIKTKAQPASPFSLLSKDVLTIENQISSADT